MEAKPPRRTRERILELSLKLFNEIGEPNVTTTTIAEEMEISPGNLYYHFRNKDDIINSIFSQFEQEIEKRLRFPDDHRATIDEMWSYLQYMVDFTWRYRFLYRIQDAKRLSSLREPGDETPPRAWGLRWGTCGGSGLAR